MEQTQRKLAPLFRHWSYAALYNVLITSPSFVVPFLLDGILVQLVDRKLSCLVDGLDTNCSKAFSLTRRCTLYLPHEAAIDT